LANKTEPSFVTECFEKKLKGFKTGTFLNRMDGQGVIATM
jgi:hypothetical protein